MYLCSILNSKQQRFSLEPMPGLGRDEGCLLNRGRTEARGTGVWAQTSGLPDFFLSLGTVNLSVPFRRVRTSGTSDIVPHFPVSVISPFPPLPKVEVI